MAKRGGCRRNAGRKSAWNSTEESAVIRLPSSLVDSLKLAKQVQVDVEELVSVIDELSNNTPIDFVTKSMQLNCTQDN